MAHSTDEGLGDEMITWLETNVPAIRHVVVPNPGGRRWLELWNMAITQKAEEYYRIVNNLLDNSGGAQDDAMSSAALNMGYLLWKLTQVVDEDLEWRNKNQEQYSPPAHLEPAQHTGPLLKCGEKATKPDWGRATRLGPFETEDQAGIPKDDRRWLIVGSSNKGNFKLHNGRVWHCYDCPNCKAAHRTYYDKDGSWYREETGHDTHTHAPALRLQNRRGDVVSNGIHARWRPLVDFAINTGALPSRIRNELERLADDDEEARVLLPTLAQIQRRSEYLVSKACASVPEFARVVAHPTRSLRTGS